MTRLKTLALAVAGLMLAPTLSWAQTHNGKSIGQSLMNLNAATLQGDPAQYGRGDIWSRLRRDFRLSEVNPELVRRHEQYYASRSPYFNRTITRSQPYLYHIVSEVQKRQMPAEIALLPFIESAFVTKAKSHVGASGLWQFMPATGRQYGLEQTPLYDGRHDVYAATDAALNYLQYLHGMFGDWSLALAAYNWGEGSVGRAVARARAQGLEPVYENLRMPNETRNYVPKLLAVRNLINNPQAFGLNLAQIDNKPYFGVVTVDQPLDIQAAARLAGIDETEFLKLNPSFNTPVFMPKANRKMLLPVSAVSAFERNYRAANKADLLSWDIYTAYSSTSLSDIAAQSGMSVSEIKRLNNLRSNSNNVAAGRSLLLAKNSLSSGVAAFSHADDTDPLLDLAQSHTRPAPAGTVPVLTVAAAAEAAPSAVVHTTTDVLSAPVETAAVSANLDTLIAQKLDQHQDKAGPALSSGEALSPLAADGIVHAAASVVDTQAQAREAVAAVLAQETGAAVRGNEPQRRTVAAAGVKAKPANITHKVQAGDTLYAIARRYQMDVAELVRVNGLKGRSIRQGQVLKVTANAKQPTAATQTKTVAKTKTNSKAALPASYTVKKGDTLQGIASRFKVPVAQLQKLNKSANKLRPGQKIRLTDL